MSSIVALAMQREAGREILKSSEDSHWQSWHSFARQVLLFGELAQIVSRGRLRARCRGFARAIAGGSSSRSGP